MKLRIGMTYDLRDDYLARNFSPEETAELDTRETIEALEASIRELGHEPHRIGGIHPLVEKLAEGDRWDLVFNIAEGMFGLGREAQIPALLDAYRIPYTFSDPMVLGLTLHKGMTKHVLKNLNVPTADFLVVNTPEDLKGISLPFPLFVKPAAEGTGKGISDRSLVRNLRDLESLCRELLVTYRQPVLVETFLPGREFTVGILGTGRAARALPPMEVVFREELSGASYSYETKKNYLDRVEYRLIDGDLGRACEEVALAAWRGLGCRDGGRLDLRMDAAGVPNFIEVNPLAGLNPADSDLPILCRLSGISYTELIREILDSALERSGLRGNRQEARESYSSV